MRKPVLFILAAAGLVAVAGAQTPARTPAELIQARQANYKQIYGAFKGIADQNKAESPDIAVIRTHSATLARLSALVGGWFPRGTGPETGVRMRAKAEIWQNPDDFRTRSATFLVAARQLDAAAQSGDLAAVRTAFTGVQRACSGCHDLYRGPAES